MKDTSGNYLLKVDKETGTSETFFVDNFLIVDDTTLGNKGDKKGFIGDLETLLLCLIERKIHLAGRMRMTILGNG